jgi:CDP-6-deoxy-D-xylo-4-hexulose-3-dehydrase
MRKFNFVSTGFNIRPMEIQAAVGRSQLKDLDSFVQKRRENVRIVSDALIGTKLEILGLDKESDILSKTDHSWMHIPIKINDKEIQEIDIRARIVRFLEDYGIETRPPLTGNFVKQPAMARFGSEQLQYSFPLADRLSRSVFLVGCHHDLSNEQINHLATKLRQAAIDLI